MQADIEQNFQVSRCAKKDAFAAILLLLLDSLAMA